MKTVDENRYIHPMREQGDKLTKICPSDEFKFREAYDLNFHFLKKLNFFIDWKIFYRPQRSGHFFGILAFNMGIYRGWKMYGQRYRPVMTRWTSKYVFNHINWPPGLRKKLENTISYHNFIFTGLSQRKHGIIYKKHDFGAFFRPFRLIYQVNIS